MSSKRRYSEVSEALTLSSAATSSVSFYETKDVNGNDTKHIKSTTRHSGVRDFTHKQLTDILCPPWRATRLWYGNSFTMATGTVSAVANTKIVNWNGAAQAHNTFVHLPKSIDTGNTYSLQQLIKKAADISNVAAITARPDPSLGTNSFEQQFAYYGGYVEHIFINTSNSNIEMEFYLCTPRRFLSHSTTDQGHLPVQDAYQSKTNNAPLANSLDPQNVTADYDAGNDVMFRFDRRDTTLHFNWKCAPPKRATLLPGQKLIYTVRLPSFHFTESAFNTSLGKIGASTLLPEFLPFCTVVLDVRARGEIQQTTDATPKVGYGPGQYTHLQREYHSCRAVPYQPTNNAIHINNLDVAADADANYNHINPLTEAQVAYDEV